MTHLLEVVLGKTCRGLSLAQLALQALQLSLILLLPLADLAGGPLEAVHFMHAALLRFLQIRELQMSHALSQSRHQASLTTLVCCEENASAL